MKSLPQVENLVGYQYHTMFLGQEVGGLKEFGKRLHKAGAARHGINEKCRKTMRVLLHFQFQIRYIVKFDDDDVVEDITRRTGEARNRHTSSGCLSGFRPIVSAVISARHRATAVRPLLRVPL